MNVAELRKQNCMLEQKLSKSENEDMTKIVAYLRGSNISDMNQELVRQDILDIVLSAKERGEEINQVIGSDYKQFCDEIIAEIKPKSVKEKIADIFATVLISASALILIKMIFSTAGIIRMIMLKQPVDLNIPIQYLDIFSMVILIATSWAIVEVILKDAFDKNDTRTKIIVGTTFAIPIIAFVLMYGFRIGTGVLFEINVIAGYLIAVLIYIISKMYDKKKK